MNHPGGEHAANGLAYGRTTSPRTVCVIETGKLDESWQRRTVYYAFALALVMLAYAVSYHAGMVSLEGEEVSFLHSLQVVVETFTTTGFGSDAPWEHPWMNVLVSSWV